MQHQYDLDQVRVNMADKYVYESSDELDGIDVEDNEGEEVVTVEPDASLEKDEELALIIVI